MNYQIVTPQICLRPFIQYCWTLETKRMNSAVLELITTADNSSGIMLQCAQLKGEGLYNGKGKALPGCFLYGQQTGPGRYFVQTHISIAGVVFQPQGIHKLFRFPAFKATNRIIAFKEFCSESYKFNLNKQLPALDRLALLETFLISKIPGNSSEDQSFTRVLKQIQNQPELFSVSELKDLLGISTRQLERKFNQTIGVSPGYYLRVMRFKKAMELIKSGEFNKFSDIAYSLYYTDQSHFIKEVRYFSGLNPKKLIGFRSKYLNELGLPVSMVNLADFKITDNFI
ncbi:helix-turn-helix transcriptional regulator [Algoriphagus sp. Y33]|uniref:helix-turn-helix transcriptional regulator n=1 Tax=Algoriphagus sp. Y33 TaxID=2772483 RepID=UPI0017843695|nr:helix-turn-helix transcriptional regulator [Algoriphagus sp. Y33]